MRHNQSTVPAVRKGKVLENRPINAIFDCTVVKGLQIEAMTDSKLSAMIQQIFAWLAPRSRHFSAGVVLCLAVLYSAPGLTQTAATQAFVKQLHWARAGDLDAQLFVAKAFAEGEMVERDMQQAVGWYMRAAKRGNLEAQFQAAKILHAGANGVKRQPLSATKLYKAAAKRGHPKAQNWLGYAYQHGHGVIKNYSTAADWYKNAANQGLAEAQNNLALLYLVGNGVEQDHVRAAELFQKAVDQGNPFAMNNLAGMYEVGWGVQRDAEKAKELYRSAALTGNSSAIENLERLGEPVPAEAQRIADELKRGHMTAVLETTTDPSETDDDILRRDDIYLEVPDIDASDQEFEEWLAEQDDAETETPNTYVEDSGPFDFLRKNWGSVNRQRQRTRRRGPADTLR